MKQSLSKFNFDTEADQPILIKRDDFMSPVAPSQGFETQFGHSRQVPTILDDHVS